MIRVPSTGIAVNRELLQEDQSPSRTVISYFKATRDFIFFPEFSCAIAFGCFSWHPQQCSVIIMCISHMHLHVHYMYYT